jgi:glycosyltransferase involved in cell wall biosynthesis
MKNLENARRKRLMRSLRRDRPFLDLFEPLRASEFDRDPTKPRLLYLAGTGDALGLFQQELLGIDARRELALPYSSQVVDVCESLGIDLLTVVEGRGGRTLDHGRVRIEEHGIPFTRARGAAFHLGKLLFGLKVAWIAIRYRPQTVLAATSSHWFTLSLLSWMNVRVITSLHNSFWPAAHRPRSGVGRAILKLNGMFWRRCVSATIAVSEECARQAREIASDSTLPIRVVVAQYPDDLPPRVSPPSKQPFRILFAGRLERYKGVWDVLNAAKLLAAAHPGQFVWTIGGDGEELLRLREATQSEGLTDVVSLPGRLTPMQLIEAIDSHHVLLTPTTSSFSEGLQKVALEGVLRGRPVITTVFSNAFGMFRPALLECRERDPQSIAEQVKRLADDPALYEATRSASDRLSGLFHDRSLGYGRALKDFLKTNG